MRIGGGKFESREAARMSTEIFQRSFNNIVTSEEAATALEMTRLDSLGDLVSFHVTHCIGSSV